jgi:hypothetical protein
VFLGSSEGEVTIRGLHDRALALDRERDFGFSRINALSVFWNVVVAPLVQTLLFPVFIHFFTLFTILY